MLFTIAHRITEVLDKGKSPAREMKGTCRNEASSPVRCEDGL